MAERERCAKIAESFDSEEIPGEVIADMIRNPDQWNEWQRQKREREIHYAESRVRGWQKKVNDELEWEVRTGKHLPQMPAFREQLRLAEERLSQLRAGK